ncbi:MAG: T9SS C-terminal target domain-containing protein [Haliscomenobacteraceae bacterium CHB4]|nr:T9SS C-terminal target domain-containing protein [Haliscomenobacteraceae bacterium CHB4]
MKTILLILLRLALLLLLPYFLRAQVPLNIAREYVRTHLDEWGLTARDAEGMTVNDMYTDKTSGITRVYFLQRHLDIPVYNAILNVSIAKEGKVFFAGNRFVPDLSGKVNTTEPAVEPAEAVSKLAAHLGLPAEVLRLKSKTGKMQFVFEKGNIAKEDITVALSYQPHQGKVLLAWDILFSPVGASDQWSTRVDAVTGAVLNEYNWTLSCFGDDMHPDREDCDSFGEYADDNNERRLLNFESLVNAPQTGPQYNVWPAPLENPNQGPRTLVADPADPLASPFGWHDTNGQPGAEYTITRGNNVWAYQDRDDLGYSSQDEPNGGFNLHFDFPFDPSWEPEEYLDAATVNLFYWVNYMHDFTYHFGFDEPAGNFQKNNYGNGGLGNDWLYAVVQDGANVGFANNAKYNHGNEGTPGVIRMFIFHRDKRFLTVNEPASIAGGYETLLPGAGWGAGVHLTNVPVTGEVVPVNDGVEDPSTADACDTILNAPELAGKIALIDRGGCQFGFKALQAQNAGAIAVIVCNYDNEDFSMGGGPSGPSVHIPIVMIKLGDAQVIRQFAGTGLHVTLVASEQDSLPKLDSDLDNCIIAHEFGHGVSNRLTGGPNTTCLDNAENMGEGWSDFLALVTFVRPGDAGSMKRGFATYALEDEPTEKGFRRYPYSTDMNVNPLTYGDVAPNTEVHDMGEVWASLLWEMYWALVEKYGWTPDPFDTSGGNYKAIRLVFEGLKNNPCDPGFVDGRNAILAADSALYNGENACLIWAAFAKRGLGYSADQGSPYDAGDQREAFDVPPVCANKIIIEKSVTGFIQPGDDIAVSIKVGNYKPETVTAVVVADEIPAGTSFKPNSSNLPVSVQGNTLAFGLGSMNFEEETTITYKLETNPNAWSERYFRDDVPDENNTWWLLHTIGTDSTEPWSVTGSLPAHSGIFAWHAGEVKERSRRALELNPDVYTFHVEGDRPVLRFFHRYHTKGGVSGGIVEVREVGASSWIQVAGKMLRNGYSNLVSYLTFVTPNVAAFSGNGGNNFLATYVDLSEWAGKDIQVRFRFGTTEYGNPGLGWLIDDIEFMDMLAYNGEACVTSDQGDLECALAPEEGTIVDSKAEPLAAGEQSQEFGAKIYPNPAKDMITVALPGETQQAVNVSLLTADGRLLKSFDSQGHNHFFINTSTVPAGLYFVAIHSAEGRHIAKVVIQK